MKDLKLHEFLNRSDDFINNAAMGAEFYSVQTNSGKAIIISEEKFKALIGMLQETTKDRE